MWTWLLMIPLDGAPLEPEHKLQWRLFLLIVCTS